MALIVKHEFVSTLGDGADADQIQPSNWNAEHTLSGSLPTANVDGLDASLATIVTSNSISTMIAAFAQPAGDYVTSGSISTMITAEITTQQLISSNSVSILAASLNTEWVTSDSISSRIAAANTEWVTSDSISSRIVTANAEFVTSDSISTRIAATYDLGPNVISSSTSYSLAVADVGQSVVMDNASTNYVWIPSSASIAIGIGEVVNVIQKGAGATIIHGMTGVTVNGSLAGSATIQTQYQGVSLLKESADNWIASGDIGTFAT